MDSSVTRGQQMSQHGRGRQDEQDLSGYDDQVEDNPRDLGENLSDVNLDP